MINFKLLTITVLVISVISICQGQDDTDWNLQNLDGKCLHCLCRAATDCDLARRCEKEYCGPYKIGKIYWIDAENVTLPADSWQRHGAFEDCANDYRCAQRIVKKYITKYGRDCNSDGVTDCYDYMMIHFNGGWGCSNEVEKQLLGPMWIQRYTDCMAET